MNFRQGDVVEFKTKEDLISWLHFSIVLGMPEDFGFNSSLIEVKDKRGVSYVTEDSFKVKQINGKDVFCLFCVETEELFTNEKDIQSWYWNAGWPVDGYHLQLDEIASFRVFKYKEFISYCMESKNKGIREGSTRLQSIIEHYDEW